ADAPSPHALSRYGGLARRRPVVALAFAVLLLAQAGVPLTAGFWAKVQVIRAAIGASRARVGCAPTGKGSAKTASSRSAQGATRSVCAESCWKVLRVGRPCTIL
ncbi:MAG: proton-conducting transporter membrane subunit, partial [Acidimicrobiaceae bacterium]|nr:proton-conducting transporter membrane subunit [Acidimicrobiaceae bacterium]